MVMTVTPVLELHFQHRVQLYERAGVASQARGSWIEGKFGRTLI